MRKLVTLCSVLVPLLLTPWAHAKTLVVGPTGTVDYATITEAMNAALADSTVDRIIVNRGTYAEDVAFTTALTLQGEEAAATFLTGTVSLVNDAVLERFTVKHRVNLTGVGSATVRNNIFTEVSGTALSIDPGDGVTDPGVHVINNTFFSNTGKAVELVSASTAQIAFNIFSGNGTAVARSIGTWGDVSTNWLFNNTTTASTGTLNNTNKTGDPQFVSSSSAPPDLHILKGTAACGLGAYGDLAADSSPDPTPAPPTGLLQEEVSGGIRLTWNGNLACDSSVSGYRVKFSPTAGGAYTKLADFASDGDGSQSFTVDPDLYALGALPAAPATPAGTAASPLDSSIRVTWSAVDGAAGYFVVWGTAADALTHTEDAGNLLNHVVENLVNGTPYYAAVEAYKARVSFFAVSAFSGAAPAGETDELRRSNTRSAVTGKSSSTPSAVATATPDHITGFPSLEERKGCFLQTLGGQMSSDDLGILLRALFLLAPVLWLARSKQSAPRAPLVLLLLCSALLLPSASRAEDPRWAFSFSGGVFYPKADGWSDNYDKKYLWEGKLGLGFRLFRQLEIGVDGGYGRAKGEITQTDNGSKVDPPVEQKLTLIPVQAYALLQFCFAENQWVVPYVAGGYSRYYYIHEIDGGDKVKGHQAGYHVRGGLKILLDVLDRYFSDRASEHWGIKNTYLNLEAQYAKVNDRGESDVDLGGMSYSAGFVIEF